MKQWKFRRTKVEASKELANALDIPQALARILVSRGYETSEEATAFLDASYADLSRPFALPNMGVAVETIEKAIAENKKIAIYGDYDVDGICASTLLREALSWFNVEARVYIPSRFSEGYGLNASALEKLKEDGVEVIVTVDTGIASAALIKEFTKKGMTFLVTDHHQLPDELPPCTILHPLLDDDVTHAFHHLCGCGTAYFLAMGLLIRLKPELYDHTHQMQLLDLVALATVADMVPLVKDNRILVKEGLKVIASRQRPGLSALIKMQLGESENIMAQDIAFRLAPCINACGRLDRTEEALQMLSASGFDDVEKLAVLVQASNEERKVIEKSITEQAIAQLEDIKRPAHCVVAVGHHWHLGVIGIVASRLVEQFQCPAIVLTTSAEKPGILTGSARSVKGFNLFENLKAVDEYLDHYGGHELAAGLSLPVEKLDDFRSAIIARAEAQEADFSVQELLIDGSLKLEDVSLTLYDALTRLEPCGLANEQPLFAVEHQHRFDTQDVGRDGSHLRLIFHGAELDVNGIAFRKGGYEFKENRRYDFAARVTENVFRGNRSVQLQVDEIVPSYMAAESITLETFMEKGAHYTNATQSMGIADCVSFKTKIRGVSFNERQQVIATLEAGDSLTLVRERTNPADANAIACVTEDGRQVGYLSRSIALQLAPLMDLGVAYACQVEQITGTDEQTKGVNITVTNVAEANVEANQRNELQTLESLEKEDLEAVLLETFLGDRELLPIQEEAIRNIVHNHKNTAIIMPTGRGKSLIYQMSAALLATVENKMTVVISPLKALIADQALILSEKLAPLGYRILVGNGDLTRTDRHHLKQSLEEGRVDILLTTPEFFVMHQALFQSGRAIGQIVIDEAHYLISRRPAYKRLLALRDSYQNAVWTYMTATVPATESASFKEIISDAGLYIDDFIRYNLHIIDARHTEQRLIYLYRLMMHDDKTICYVNSRRQAFTLARRLREILPYALRHKVYYYHGGLPHQVRQQVEDAFRGGDIKMLFATTAFGEGVNIPDIRNVVLYHPCFSVESFNQLSGRCARDGETGNIHLLYSERDLSLNEMIAGENGPSRKDLGKMYLRLKAYAQTYDRVIEATANEVYENLAEYLPEYTVKQWHLALEIFSELEFIRMEEQEGIMRISFDERPNKRDLEESAVYLEGMSEVRALKQFEQIAFSTDIAMLERVIQSALYPAEWKGRETTL